jgi:uncharacterized surface protein with fasciclin (FAS1) repeats
MSGNPARLQGIEPPPFRATLMKGLSPMMKSRWVVSAVTLVLVFGGVIRVADAGCGTCDKTVVENAAANESFKTLVAAVKAAGLAETLSGPGPFTVFAPTDEAFAKLPAGTLESLLKPENKSKLVEILTYHVVPGNVKAKDVVGLKDAKTVNGKNVTITVKEGTVFVDGAKVVKTDITSKNGVIHVIDAVILPKN